MRTALRCHDSNIDTNTPSGCVENETNEFETVPIIGRLWLVGMIFATAVHRRLFTNYEFDFKNETTTGNAKILQLSADMGTWHLGATIWALGLLDAWAFGRRCLGNRR